jgi:UDPglucose 6-dehydrogenase
MGADSRIGKVGLDAGLGYGGECFSKDLAAFDRLASSLGYAFPILGEITRINAEAVEAAARRVARVVQGLEGKKVAILGLSHTPGTDDVTFAPALALARLLLSSGARVAGYDPRASANAKAQLSELEVAPSPYAAASGAHCLVLATGWDEFRSLKLRRLRRAMACPVVIDGRNFLDPERMRRAGFTYHSVGGPSLAQERAPAACG